MSNTSNTLKIKIGDGISRTITCKQGGSAISIYGGRIKIAIKADRTTADADAYYFADTDESASDITIIDDNSGSAATKGKATWVAEAVTTENIPQGTHWVQARFINSAGIPLSSEWYRCIVGYNLLDNEV